MLILPQSLLFTVCVMNVLRFAIWQRIHRHGDLYFWFWLSQLLNKTNNLRTIIFHNYILSLCSCCFNQPHYTVRNIQVCVRRPVHPCKDQLKQPFSFWGTMTKTKIVMLFSNKYHNTDRKMRTQRFHILLNLTCHLIISRVRSLQLAMLLNLFMRILLITAMTTVFSNVFNDCFADLCFHPYFKDYLTKTHWFIGQKTMRNTFVLSESKALFLRRRNLFWKVILCLTISSWMNLQCNVKLRWTLWVAVLP